MFYRPWLVQHDTSSDKMNFKTIWQVFWFAWCVTCINDMSIGVNIMTVVIKSITPAKYNES